MPARRGFSLIEIIIALMLLGLLAGVAAPKYADSLNYFRVESAAKRIAADLHGIRRQAIQKAANTALEVEADRGGYTLTGADHVDRLQETYTVIFAEEGYPATISAIDFGGAETIGFNHHGDATSAGSITVRAGDYTRKVTILFPCTISISK